MRIGAIIQARMSSRRLPGKVLRCALGKPLLLYLHDRISRCSFLDAVIVSTSTRQSDDPIAELCRRSDIACFRGSLHNVAARFNDTLEVYQLDAFVRISGDSPLLDQRLIDQALALFRRKPCDLVSNVFPRTFPPGQSVEVVHRKAYRRTLALMTDKYDREHVTPFFYRHPDRYRIVNMSADREYGRLHLAVDTLQDFEAFEAIVRQMESPHWQYSLEQIVDLHGRLATPSTEASNG